MSNGMRVTPYRFCVFAALFPIYQHFHKGFAPRIHSPFGKCIGILITEYPQDIKSVRGYANFNELLY